MRNLPLYLAPFKFAPLKTYAFAAMVAIGAVAFQWLVLPVVGTRVPFMFPLLVIGLTAFLLGFGPSLVVLVCGALNAAIQFPPAGLAIEQSTDRSALLLFILVGIGIAYSGYRVRSLFHEVLSSEVRLKQTKVELQRQIADLERLHDLSAKLPAIPTLSEQLALILRSLADMHGTEQGLVSLYDVTSNELDAAASLGFSGAALQRLKVVHGGGVCGSACVERRRVIVADTEIDPLFASFRELARDEKIRAVHSTPLISHTGEMLGAISVHFPVKTEPTEREIRLADMCARKAAVYIEKARAEAHANEIDKRFRSVLDSSAVPFTLLKPVRDGGSIVDFSWTYLNTAAARVAGRSAVTLIGKRVTDIFPGAWNDASLFEHYVAVADDKEVREFERRSTTTPNEAWFHVVASPLDGGVAVWFADVTDRKRQEHELRTADRRKDEFLATLAHELRNPLAPIRQAAVAARKPSATEAQKQWCNEVIDRQAQHMALLLDDLLDMSRITRGILQLRKQPTTLSVLVESALEIARPLIESKRHTLKMDMPPEPVQLDVDPLRLSQVITNLLTNAAKYTDPEGTVRLAGSFLGSDLVLQVSDNGIGMAREELLSIFTMFSQVKGAQERSEGGLGIGLALTKGLLRLHGGTITASSAGIGTGSTFTVKIPNVLLAGDRKAKVQNVAARSSVTHRILLADDNQDAATSLAMLLQMDGHEVTIAHDGQEAFELLETTRADVMLLDLGMPRMSGYELAKRVRAGKENNDVLLIAITGWGQNEDRTRSADAGFDHHVTKPLDYAELAKLLATRKHSEKIAISG